MRSELIDDSLWFQHANGFRLFPWIRFSKHHGYSSFWVSDGSNHISDAIPVATVSELVLQVFTNGRSIWLCDGGSPSKCGLYRFGAQVMRLADLPERLHEFDIVVSCTASQLPILGLGAVERTLKKRRHRPMFMVDLAVPRDIEPEVAQLDDVYLYTVDDLAQVVQTGQANRQAAVAQAEVIIDAGVQSFMHWLDQRDPAGGVVPLIRQLNAQADEWRALELARARKRLAKGEDVEAVLEALSRGLTQKMLHGAMAELHGAAPEARDGTTQAIERLFLRGTPPRQH